MITLYMYPWMMPAIGILFYLIGFDIQALAPNDLKPLSLAFALWGTLFMGTWIVVTIGQMFPSQVVMVP